jgi:hypothetical protein
MTVGPNGNWIDFYHDATGNNIGWMNIPDNEIYMRFADKTSVTYRIVVQSRISKSVHISKVIDYIKDNIDSITFGLSSR